MLPSTTIGKQCRSQNCSRSLFTCRIVLRSEHAKTCNLCFYIYLRQIEITIEFCILFKIEYFYLDGKWNGTECDVTLQRELQGKVRCKLYDEDQRWIKKGIKNANRTKSVTELNNNSWNTCVCVVCAHTQLFLSTKVPRKRARERWKNRKKNCVQRKRQKVRKVEVNALCSTLTIIKSKFLLFYANRTFRVENWHSHWDGSSESKDSHNARNNTQSNA